MSAEPFGLALRYDRLTVRVSAGAEADLVWLEQFLTPWFERAGGDADCRVDLVADDGAYRDSVALASRSDGEEAQCFSLDRGELSLPSWKLDGGRLVRDDRLRCFYAVDESTARVRVLAAPGNMHARFAAMRVVRELAMEQARAERHLILHAACLAAGDDAFLIAGPKGAGKTSLLLRGLMGGAGRFLSNDRVVVQLTASDALVRGMPTLVSIRRESLRANTALRRRLEQAPPRHWLALRTETAKPVPLNASSIDLTPAQVCAMLGVEASPAGRVRALLFPRVDTGGAPPGATELDPKAARVLLSQAHFGNGSEAAAASLFAALLPRRADPLPPAAALDDLAARVPAFECRMGDGEEGIGRALADVFDRCSIHLRGARPPDGHERA